MKKPADVLGCLNCGEITTLDTCPRCGSSNIIGPLEPTNAAANLAEIRRENYE